MINKTQFKDLHSRLMASPGEEGGFSVNVGTGEEPPPRGAMVSYEGETMHTPASATRPSHLANYVNRNREGLSRSDSYFGGWKPESDEFTTLDRSQHIDTDPKVSAEYGEDVADIDAVERALDIGISRQQFSVFSNTRGRSIATGAR